jgi:hypothetical protein
MNNQKNCLNIGLKKVLLISDVLIKGNNRRTTKAAPIATTPPTLWGIDLSIA